MADVGAWGGGAQPPGSAGSGRILVIDDEPANVHLLRQMLSKAGYEDVIATNDAVAAAELFRTHQPDLVLLDLHMPVFDGFEVMAQLHRATAPDDYRPVLVITADISDDTADRALAAGATDLVTKPFRMSEVLLRIRNLLETRRLHVEVQRRATVAEAQLAEVDRQTEHELERRQEVTQRIEAILAGTGLAMAYQPIVDLRTEHVVGVEALARFSAAPVRTPDVWFAEAAEVGLGLQLELRAVELALAGLPHFPSAQFLSMNASPGALRSPALLAHLDEPSRHRLVIELAEHEPVTDYRPLVDSINGLRDHGIRIAVDDTGSGVASLQHIVKLQPDFIKLDRGLIEAIDADPAKRALVSALKSFAYDTRSKVIAEGIETEAELATLRDLGITLGQGYLLGRPAPL